MFPVVRTRGDTRYIWRSGGRTRDQIGRGWQEGRQQSTDTQKLPLKLPAQQTTATYRANPTRHTVCSGNNLGSIQVQLRFNFTLKQRRTGTKRQLHPCCPPSRTASSHTPTPMPAIRITGDTPTPTAGKSAHTRLIAHAQPLAFRRSVMRSRYSQ